MAAERDVTLLFQEDPAVHEDYVLQVQADTNGDIYWDQWAPEEHDLGVRFYLMATGLEVARTDHIYRQSGDYRSHGERWLNYDGSTG